MRNRITFDRAVYGPALPARQAPAATLASRGASNDGYILYDTANADDAEDVLVGGMQKLGLDPAKVKYVIVSHGHRGESGGAYLFQSRYGAHIVTADWDLIEGSLYGYPTGKPKRDITATDGMTVTVGERTVTLYLTPGHTRDDLPHLPAA